MPSTERSPLLRPTERHTDEEGTIARANTNADNISPSDLEPETEELSTSRLLLVMVSIWVGVFFSGLDSTIVSTLSAPISNSFNSFTTISWLASSYLIANAALQPISGRLTDVFGRRTGLIASNVFFGVGTLICGLAKDEWVIIFGRIIAGIGGGCLNSISTMVGSDLIPLRRRGLWQGIGNIFWGLGSGLGGVYGGYIHSVLSWRWAFLLQVPFILASSVLVALVVKIPLKDPHISTLTRLKRIDFTGSFLLIASLVLLLLGLNYGGNLVPWTHPLVLTSIPLSLLCLLLFILAETRIPEPIIPVHLLLNRTVLSACLVNWFATMAQYGLHYYGPIYFQSLGLTPTQAGLRVMPNAIGVVIGSLGAGYIMRASGRYWYLSLCTQIIFVLGTLCIALTFTRDMDTWPPFLFFAMSGLGYASMLTITLIAFISAVEQEYQAVITSASYAFRSTGATIGITIGSAVFQNLLREGLEERFGGWPGAREEIERIRNSLEEIGRLPLGWYDGVIDAYMEALRGVWWAVVGLAGLGAVISLFMRENRLHNTLKRK